MIALLHAVGRELEKPGAMVPCLSSQVIGVSIAPFELFDREVVLLPNAVPVYEAA